MGSVPASQLSSSGRFELRRRLGEGAVGVVHEAYDREHGALVALKTLRVADPEALLSLKSEFRAVQGIRHRNLVSLGELLEEDGTWFFTMELLRGMPFVQALQRDPSPLSSSPANTQAAQSPGPTFHDAKLRDALAQLVEGLRALHAAGFVHRDIKPSNVLVTHDERVVILDFGIAKDVVHRSRADDGMVGTVTYMAPEQALGEGVTEASDWYAVGAVLYQVLTGTPPFVGSAQAVIEAKMSGTPPAPSTLAKGVPPDLDALCMALLQPDPDARPRGEGLAAMLGLRFEEQGPSVKASLVGRERELDTLQAARTDVLSGQGVSVLVSGESGVGKSFLLEEFIVRLEASEPRLLLLQGRCYERESVPYKAFDGIVDRLSGFLAQLPDDALLPLLPTSTSLLMRAFPVLQTLQERIRARSIDVDVANPQELRARIFAGVRELFTRVAQSRPLVLVIDDLQWADADSFQLLHELMHPPDAPPLLLVATVRTGTETRRVGDVSALDIPGDVRQVVVQTLSESDASALVIALLTRAGEASPPPEQVRNIVLDAKGHPLFLEELVRQRLLGQGGDAVRLDDALWQRVSRLELSERRVLEMIAVAGVPITQDAAARTAGLDFSELFRVATKLRSEGLLRMSGARRSSALESYHDRVRESVLGNLSADAQKQWHARLAVVLEELPDVDAEVVASHWHGAGNAQRAAEHYVLAAEQASSALAFDRAVRLYGLALRESSFGEDRQRQLKHALSDALVNAGQLSAAADLLLELAEGADPAERLSLHRMASQHLMCSGHFERGVGLLNDSLKALGAYNPKSRGALIGALLFSRLRLSLRGLDMRTGARARRSPRDLMLADAFWSAGHGFGMNDNIRGAYFHSRALRAHLDIGDARSVVRSLAMTITTTSAAGLHERPRVERMLARERMLAEELATPEALAFAAGAAGFAHVNFGEWRDAKVWLDRAEALFRDQCVGAAYELGSLRLMLMRTLFALGDMHELAQRAEPILRRALQQNDLYQVLMWQSVGMAPAALMRDDVVAAERAIAEAQALLPSAVRLQHYWTFTGEAYLSLYRGDFAAAYRRMDWLYGALKRELLTNVAGVRMFVMSLRGRAAAALARVEGARGSHFARAAEADARALEREPIAWGKAAARSIDGVLAMARGEVDRAVAAHCDAAERYSLLDMRLFAAACRRIEGALRGGDSGRELLASADAAFAAQGIAAPTRMTTMLAGEGPDVGH